MYLSGQDLAVSLKAMKQTADPIHEQKQTYRGTPSGPCLGSARYRTRKLPRELPILHTECQYRLVFDTSNPRGGVCLSPVDRRSFPQFDWAFLFASLFG